MAKARFDIPSQLPAGVTRPIYAGVGVTDRVVEGLRLAVADVQKRAVAAQRDVRKTAADLDYSPQALREQATQVLAAHLEALGKEAQDFPARLQKLVDEQVATAGDTYEGLVKRGETLVGRIRHQQSTVDTAESAATTTAKARTTRTQAAKTAGTAKKSAARTTKKAAKSPARSSAKATSTSAKKTASNAARATKDAVEKVGD
jgi:heparin binding hemagglutinin HbhA